jgi:putative PIN family toxin of toxin-antitoxin system
MTPTVVLDTNVFISALRSSRGASHQVLRLVGRNKFDIELSVPLVLEYEEAAKRQSRQLGLTHADIDDILDYLCRVGRHHAIHFLWRPHLRDPEDDMVLELAVEAEAEFIVTHNVRDFAGVESFGLRVIEPQELLAIVGESK